jgi:2-keto-4-pentenoate hydratase/2-oxohepta-3-ene-1,7-dioic acid hydratase in catechol pathway
MTGTPSGVGAFMKPPAWLQDGDVVEVEISEIGTIRNKMVMGT